MDRKEAELLRAAEGYNSVDYPVVIALKWKLIREYGTPDGVDCLITEEECPACKGRVYSENLHEMYEPCSKCGETGYVTKTTYYRRYNVAGVIFRADRVTSADAMYDVHQTFRGELPRHLTTIDEAYLAFLKLCRKYDEPKFLALLRGFNGARVYEQHKDEINEWCPAERQQVA